MNIKHELSMSIKKKIAQSILASLLITLLGTSVVIGQASPAATATGKVGEATITITYSSPSVKGREIWGGLVPYDKVWRAGANKATIFETDKDITLEGKKLPAGQYSFYALPGEKEWEIYLNSETGQWGVQRSGESTRNPEKDVLAVTVKSVKSDMNESLVYEITENGVSLKWELLEIPLKIN
jgi:hypothetical protein